MSPRFRGHRAHSFQAIDTNELVELRARHRTFHGAYNRAALANLGYSLTILRLFDRRFYRIGLLYAALAGLLFVISYIRARHSDQDFADPDEDDPLWRRAKPTRGQEDIRVFGRPFVTAGWIVITVAAVVAGMEITLLVMILQV